jgi:hypothetical protein
VPHSLDNSPIVHEFLHMKNMENYSKKKEEVFTRREFVKVPWRI